VVLAVALRNLHTALADLEADLEAELPNADLVEAPAADPMTAEEDSLEEDLGCSLALVAGSLDCNLVGDIVDKAADPGEGLDCSMT